MVTYSQSLPKHVPGVEELERKKRWAGMGITPYIYRRPVMAVMEAGMIANTKNVKFANLKSKFSISLRR